MSHELLSGGFNTGQSPNARTRVGEAGYASEDAADNRHAGDGPHPSAMTGAVVRCAAPETILSFPPRRNHHRPDDDHRAPTPGDAPARRRANNFGGIPIDVRGNRWRAGSRVESESGGTLAVRVPEIAAAPRWRMRRPRRGCGHRHPLGRTDVAFRRRARRDEALPGNTGVRAPAVAPSWPAERRRRRVGEGAFGRPRSCARGVGEHVPRTAVSATPSPSCRPGTR